MNVLSLFDGHSTGYLALKNAGIKIDNYYASEIDPNPIAISENNYPDIIRLGDVTKIDVSKLPKIDLLIGGSPCQGFSRAGKCLNFNDPRSALFFEFVRILNEIKLVNPDVYFMLENVKMKNEWIEIINKNLGVKGIHINSKLVSAQHRERVYWTNIPHLTIPGDKCIRLLDILEDVSPEGFIEKDGILFDPTISEASRNLVTVVDGEVRIKQAVKKGYIVADNGDGVNLAFPGSTSRRGRVIKGKSSTLDCVCNLCVYHNGMIRRYTTTELERLQTLPDGYTEGVSETARRKAIGNGWTAEVITHIFKGLTVNKSLEVAI